MVRNQHQNRDTGNPRTAIVADRRVRIDAPQPVGTTIGRICTAKLPDTALNRGWRSPRP